MELKNIKNHKNYKNAFTLAEVLITLGIIGVVAAMTLPTLIANYQKQVYANGLKKGINTSLNMLKKMQADEGVSSLGETELFTSTTNCDNAICNDEDGYNDPSVFERIIPKYLKVVKTCSGVECNIKYKSSSLNCPNYDYTSKNCKLSVGNELLPIGKLTGSYNSHGITPPIVGFYTSDGMIFYMYSWYREGTLEMLIDINGEKAPNTIGRDVFPLRLSSRGFDLESGIYYKTLHLVANGYKMDY